jgi:hypothetical protein
MMTYRVLVFFIGLLLLTTGLAGNVEAVELKKVLAVWAEPVAVRTTVLHYARKIKGHWADPVQLSVKKGLHVTPVIAEDPKENIWIIWVEQTADENILRYAVIARDSTRKTGRVRSPGKEQSYAPTILIDSSGVPLIAWSGVTGRLADIYVSKWNGTGWDTPVMVNQQNDTPDITPVLGMQNSGNLWVTWFGFSDNHRYVRYSAQFRDGKWQVNEKTARSEDADTFFEQRMDIEKELPEQARYRIMAAVFVDSDKEIQSISERFITFQPQPTMRPQ